MVSSESISAELVSDTIPSTLGSRAELYPGESHDEGHRTIPWPGTETIRRLGATGDSPAMPRQALYQ
jgi:hypothetical protein